MIKIKELRLAAGLTQAALAEKAGCHKRIIQKIELNVSEEKNIRFGTLVKIANALGTDIYDLLGHPGDWDGLVDEWQREIKK